MLKIHLLILMGLTFVGLFSLLNESHASPSFTEQYLNDLIIADVPGGYFEDQTNVINLEKVYYKSDGQILEVSIKAHGSNGFDPENIISYGLLIDSDSNYSTGIRGFDYKYYVQWINGTWNEFYEVLPSYKKNSILISEDIIEDSFNMDDSVANLKIDLDKIGNPTHYNLVFFSQGYLNQIYFHDVTSLALIPPPSFSINAIPNPLDLESGKKHTIRILVESEFDESIEIFYSISTDSPYVNIQEIIDNHIILQNGKAEIPIILEIDGHENTIHHDLNINLGLWYPTNPNDEDVDIVDSMIRDYDHRNSVDNYDMKLLLVTLPSSSPDHTLSIQMALLVATLLLAITGTYTFAVNALKIRYDKKVEHSNEIKNIFKIMLSLISKKDHYSKEIALKYPKSEKDRADVRQKLKDPSTDAMMLTVELNSDNILHLGMAIQHLEGYDTLSTRWSSIQNDINLHNSRSHDLNSRIRKRCLESIQENLPEFSEFTGYTGKFYILDAVARECYNSIEIATEYGISRGPFRQHEPTSDGEYAIYAESQLFGSDEPIDESLVSIVLSSCVEKEFVTEYESLIELNNNIKQRLEEFVNNLQNVVNELTPPTLVNGKCYNEKYFERISNSFRHKFNLNN